MRCDTMVPQAMTCDDQATQTMTRDDGGGRKWRGLGGGQERGQGERREHASRTMTDDDDDAETMRCDTMISAPIRYDTIR